MIVDQIDHVGQYYKLGDRIETALRYLSDVDITSMDNGQYPIRGKDIYVVVSRYTPRPGDGRKYEAHRKYLDVQYIAAGHELMGYAPVEKITVTGEYDPENDALFGSVDGDLVAATAGTFFILYPRDAHMPGVAPKIGAAVEVTKAVIKVAVD